MLSFAIRFAPTPRVVPTITVVTMDVDVTCGVVVRDQVIGTGSPG